ncbi:hypothetical protein FQN60_007068 [Etheostoma spectabile]|uniref:Uncharacterized protein n=1 Tax=Etheostoma spectabile TaxID=54343 RepID=A0A5J5CDE2_9PERO|nr:hypothetical protein FQN60_007068 [Etheostoma spectabile]
MKLELERRLQDETLDQKDQTGLPDDLQQYVDQEEAHPVESAQDKSCPFGFPMEEDGLPLTMPATPSFHFTPERLVVEENSCSSDLTESCCSSSDSDAGGCPNGVRISLMLTKGCHVPSTSVTLKMITTLRAANGGT